MKNNFLSSLSENEPSSDLPDYVRSLWYDAKGDWLKAHALIDNNHDEASAWVHAYLHRKEGDNGNADYWYRRAGKIRPSVSLKEEWDQLVANLANL